MIRKQENQRFFDTTSYMKNIKFIYLALMAATVAVTVSSCRFEDDDYFDESASLRIEHQADDVQDILVSAPNGWVMQYFTGDGVAVFEGFNLFAKFEDSGKVTLAGNHRLLRDGNANKYTESASLYQLIKEEGIVLAFNTWNDVLTPFVDPVNPWKAPGTLEKDGAGMEGDQNLVVLTYSNDEITTRGERHGGKVRFVPCDRTWEEYIAATDEMKNTIANTTITSYYLTSGTDTLYLTGVRNGRIRRSERLENPLKRDSLSSVFTPNGFRLESPENFNDNTYQEFTLAEDNTCLLNEDGTVKVTACWDNYIISHTAVWNLNPEYFSAEQQNLFEKIDAALKVYNASTSLASIGIGRSTGSSPVTGLVFTFYTNTAKTKTNTMGLAMNFLRTSFGQMQIIVSPDDSVDKNMKSITSRSSEVESLARAFAATMAGTYDITPNDYFLPTGGSFKAIENGTDFALMKESN